MMRARATCLLAVAGILPAWQSDAAEICGDLIDNDSPKNGLVDEGCNPSAVTGVCDSPISCGRTGAVAPKTGQLVYHEPPDLAPRSPFGPGLALARVYQSRTADGTGYRGSLGTGWSHTFQGWLEFNATPNPDEVIVRLTSGQEVFFSWSDDGTDYDEFAPQPGFHLKHLRNYTSGTLSGKWQLTTLNGWVYEYDDDQSSGSIVLRKIIDPFGVYIILTYNTSGYLTSVTDTGVRGVRQLVFTYDGNNKLDKVEYEFDSSVVLTVQYTVTSSKLEDVTVGSTLVRDYVWTGTKLDQIKDGESTAKTIADFDYLSATAGKVARISTGDGNLGYKYGDGSCDGGEGLYVYYNDTDATDAACDADADCGTGNYCGGETSPGSGETGVCYRARRCLALSSSHDDLIDGVTSSCASCTDAKTYAWDTSPGLDLVGVQDADNVWTSYLRDSTTGQVTRMVEGDDDSDASDAPAGARITYFTYHGTLGGYLTEVKRLSELAPEGECDEGSTTDCALIEYEYEGTGGPGLALFRVTRSGLTLEWNPMTEEAEPVAFSYETLYDYDFETGQLASVTGPRTDTSYDNIEVVYWDDEEEPADFGFVRAIDRQLSVSSSLTTEYAEYDTWGNATIIQHPDGNYTCRSFHGDLGLLTVTRTPMNNQGCGSSHGSDLVTTTTYDTYRRITKVERSNANCVHREYDSLGRLSKVKERDDCNAASSGHTQELTYNDDGLTTKVEYKDASGTVTYRRETTFGADRRLLEVLNPSDTSKKKTFAYEPDGMIDSITGEDSVGKTEWVYDALNRTDLEKRYTGASTSDDWNLLPGVQLDLPFEVEDEDGKAIEWTWDDLGRKVQQVTPDGGAHVMEYDEAGNLVKHVEAGGSADELTHTFTYDAQGRLTAEDYAGTGDKCFSLGGAEVQYTFDSDTSCPSGACSNVAGRLAMVKVKIACDDNDTVDDTFDQFTYFGYDDAGRIVKETIEDDASRSDVQNYTWNENSNLTAVEAPSGVDMKWTFGSGGSNSDADKIVALVRNAGSDVTLASNTTWLPFGPLSEYEQANTKSSNAILARLTWDLAYRPTQVLYEEKTSGTDLFKIAHTLDAKGRITARDFTGAHADVDDVWYLYDWQDRIYCESTVAPSGSTCPSGTDAKNRFTSSPPYTASGDRASLYHNMVAWGNDLYTYDYETGTDQIDTLPKGGGTYWVDMAWDGRGNRLHDDDTQWADDRRDYTYDARNNLITVSGQMFISASVLHDYTITNAYDHKNRRIFKSLLDEDDDEEAQWFFYYDLDDRLIEVRYTPDMDSPTVYQLFQFYWIGSRPVAWFQTTVPAGTVTRRFIHADHLDTPLEGWTWPTSGDTTRGWGYIPDAFGWGDTTQGASVYMPLRFPGQHCDPETKAFRWNGSTAFVKTRPALNDNRYRVYDPLTGSHLQADSRVGVSWQSYQLDLDPNFDSQQSHENPAAGPITTAQANRKAVPDSPVLQLDRLESAERCAIRRCASQNFQGLIAKPVTRCGWTVQQRRLEQSTFRLAPPQGPDLFIPCVDTAVAEWVTVTCRQRVTGCTIDWNDKCVGSDGMAYDRSEVVATMTFVNETFFDCGNSLD